MPNLDPETATEEDVKARVGMCLCLSVCLSLGPSVDSLALAARVRASTARPRARRPTPINATHTALTNHYQTPPPSFSQAWAKGHMGTVLVVLFLMAFLVAAGVEVR